MIRVKIRVIREIRGWSFDHHPAREPMLGLGAVLPAASFRHILLATF